ncbi:Basic helix-loop-helix transcription factor [Parasponia andersonii]|uniref:Basic helix-loop-helix transcription factor n=1 Tax=Parasponia andersonii TaxID=3476 RepID=A0A2P5E072_PARAD|nr:Basic helix-loop-helix transcription factor [Parasponia andersonii]
MERLQGPINPDFLGDHMDMECLDHGIATTSSGSLRFEEEEDQACLLTPGLDDRMPFLQMLQSVESPSLLPLNDPSFQTRLRLQHLKKPWEMNISGSCHHNMPQLDNQIQGLEFESCVTNEIIELHSPNVKSEAKDVQYLHSSSGPDQGGVSSDCNHERQPNSVENCVNDPKTTFKHTQNAKSPPVSRERRKRKRTRPTKNKEEVESQRMTHIAVERNRRRQMNDHLNVLRSLMPTSYIQRGDQASIVGGAIDFVKELEQLLQSLEAQKRMRKAEGGNGADNSICSSSSSSTAAATAAAMPSNGLFMSLSQFRIGPEEENITSLGDEVRAETKSGAAEIEITVIQTHVNLKIQCPRRPGQLLKAIVALEDLRLAILHLNITSSHTTVFYSFNLKIEEGCKLGSADEIAGAVHQIFRFIEGT